MAEKKLIAVVGATGAQGGGLARAILDDVDGGFACRALTRHPTSDIARALADRGAEVVQADLDDTDSLTRAFAGTYGAYCMTNFFEHFSADRENEQAANLARAAAMAGVSHVIWSTSESSRDWGAVTDRLPTTQGGDAVPHWDGKARGNHFFTDSGVPTTLLRLSMFWENLVTPAAPHFPHRGPDGVPTITLPAAEAKLPGLAAEDVGRCAYGIFNAREAFVGRTIGLAGEHLTGAELAAGLSDVAGEPVRYHDVPLAAVRAAPVPGAAAVANMFQIITEANEDYCAHYDVALTRSLNPRLQTFAEWLGANRQRIQRAVATSRGGAALSTV